MAARPPFARWTGTGNVVTGKFLALGADPSRINLAGGLPDPALFPVAEIAEAAARALRARPQAAMSYGPVEGLPELREAIAARMRAEGAAVSAANILVTGGSMQGLDLIGKALLDPGDLIAAQAPTYLGALDAWRPREPRYRPLDVAAGEAADPARLSGAKFAYTVPNFSNPTGALVDAAMRGRILGAAREAGVWLVEDDPYAGLHMDGDPPPAMLAMDAEALGEGPVVYLGSLSKSLVPGLRIGWTVAPPEMIRVLALAKQGSDLSTSAVAQTVALDLLESGLVERHLAAIVPEYRRRRDAICAAAGAHLGEWFTWERPAGGMFLWLTARDPALDTDALFETAASMGVLVSPGGVFDPLGRDRRSLRLNFTLNSPDRLAEGVERLAAAVRRLLGANAR